MDLQDKTFTWVFLEEPGISIWLGRICTSNLFQNHMISGQYIGFHECSIFAKQDQWGYSYAQYTYASITRYYYKGSTSIGSTSLSYDGNVMVSPDWIWASYAGNTDGNVIGTGNGTYYAKSGSTFMCPEAFLTIAYPIDNSVSMVVSP